MCSICHFEVCVPITTSMIYRVSLSVSVEMDIVTFIDEAYSSVHGITIIYLYIPFW